MERRIFWRQKWKKPLEDSAGLLSCPWPVGFPIATPGNGHFLCHGTSNGLAASLIAPGRIFSSGNDCSWIWSINRALAVLIAEPVFIRTPAGDTT
jgi:hypothetical protein